MAKTVNVPLLGKQNKGTVIGVTIGGVVVAGYLIWRNQQKTAQQASATDQASQASAAAGYGYGLAHGYGYGQGYFGGPWMGYGYGFGPSPFPRGRGDNEGGEGGNSGSGGKGGKGGITNNAEWSRAAIVELAKDGYQREAVVAALGGYLLGREVTPSQETIVQAAIAVEGYPPQSGKDNHPPAIRVSHGGQGGRKDIDFVDAPGGEGLEEIGAKNQDSRGTINRLNPGLFARYGDRRAIPKGTKVRVH